MNNKGQSLVTFILLLPLLILLLTAIFDIGNLEVTKQKYENDIKEAINYGLENLNDENIKDKLQNMLNENIDGNKTIEINNSTIKIQVQTKIDSIFKNIFKKDEQIKITYRGYKDQEKIKIVKE